MFEAPNEPQDFGKTLDTGFRLFGAGWKRGVLIALLGILVLAVIAGGAFAALIPMLERIAEAPLFAIGMGLIAFVLIALIWTTIMNSLVAYFGSAYRGIELGIGEAFSIGMSRLFPVLGWYLLLALFTLAVALPGALIIAVAIASESPIAIFLAVVFGGLLALIPYVFVAVLFGFGSYLIVVDNMGIMEAFTESKRLVWGNWWRTFGYVLVVSLLAWVISFIISLPLAITSIIFTFSGSVFVSGFLDMVNQLLSLLVTPLSVAMTLPYIFDLQLRRSGLDLAARLA